MNTPHDATQRSYEQQIDAAVRQSQGLQSLIRAAIQDDPHISPKNSSAHVLLDALERALPANHWTSNPELASLLPMVLRTSSDDEHRNWNQSDIRQLLSSSTSKRGDIVRRLSYPIFVLILCLFVLLILGLTVVPIFKKMFEEFDLRLPPLTQFVFSISDILVGKNWSLLVTILVFIVGVLATCLAFLWLLPRLRRSTIVSFFFAGRQSELISIARWTSALAELVRIGTPLHEAIRIAGIATKDPSYQNESLRLAELLAKGEAIDGVRSNAPCFPPTVLEAWTAGPSGTPSVPVMRRMAEIYWDRAEKRGRTHFTQLGPIAIVALGLLVGLIIIALFSPLISLVSALSS